MVQGCSTTALSSFALARCPGMPVRAQCLGSTQQVPLLPPWPTHCFQGDGPDGVPGLRPDEGARSQALLTGHQEHPPPSLWALEWDVWCRSTRGRDKGRIRCRPLRNMLRMLSGDPLFPPALPRPDLRLRSSPVGAVPAHLPSGGPLSRVSILFSSIRLTITCSLSSCTRPASGRPRLGRET